MRAPKHYLSCHTGIELGGFFFLFRITRKNLTLEGSGNSRLTQRGEFPIPPPSVIDSTNTPLTVTSQCATRGPKKSCSRYWGSWLSPGSLLPCLGPFNLATALSAVAATPMVHHGVSTMTCMCVCVCVCVFLAFDVSVTFDTCARLTCCFLRSACTCTALTH